MERQTISEPSNAENRTSTCRLPVIVVGASVRWASQSLRRGGLTVWGMDQFGDRDSLEECQGFRLLDPRVHWRDQLSDWPGASDLPIIRVGGMRGESDAGGLSLQVFQKLVKLAGLNTPETHPYDSSSGAISPTERWLWKQENSTGGLGVRRWLTGKHPWPTSGVLQRWIPGQLIGFVFLADRIQVRLLGSCRSHFVRLGDRPFVYAGSRGPFNHSAIPSSRLLRLAERVAQETGLRGLFNLDAIIDRQGDLYILELNARPSGSCEVIERSLASSVLKDEESSLMKMHFDALRGGSPTQHLSVVHSCEQTSILKRIVFANRAGRLEPESLLRLRNPQLQFSDIPNSSVQVKAGDPLVTMLSQGADALTVRRTIREVQQLCRPS